MLNLKFGHLEQPSMKTCKRLLLILFLSLLYHSSALCQKKESFDLGKLLGRNNLTLRNRTAQALRDADKKGVTLDEKSGEGLAWLKEISFATGTVEIDLKGKDVFQKSFLGIAFHGTDDQTYEAVYFRPFNFHATDSVRRIHAVQYISHPNYPWKKLRDEKNGQYEKAVNPAPDPNGWFHARIEVNATQVLVYINKEIKPVLQVNRLTDRKTGKVGLWTGDGSGGDFANLTLVRKKTGIQ